MTKTFGNTKGSKYKVSGTKTKYANVDAPQPSKLVGKPGFTHDSQPQGNSIGWSMKPGRGVGGAEHHKGSTFGGKSDCIRGHRTPLLPGGKTGFN